MDIITIPCLASSEFRRTDHFDQNRGNLAAYHLKTNSSFDN